jgi:Uma2 family endonuclease
VAITQRRLTLDEFLALPEEKPALEYHDGVVTQKVSPQGQHSGLETDLAELFNRLLRPPRVGRAFAELRATFGGESYVPDVTVYRWERIPRTPDGKVANDFRLPPDVAVEILSPGQSPAETERKCRWYVANGVRAALLLSPNRETIRVFRPDAVPVTMRGADVVDLGDILPDCHFTVAEVFAALRMD